MKSRLPRPTCVVAALLLAVYAVGLAAQTHAAAHPTLVVITLDGKTFDLAAHRGEWVIVNFWATWCSPCIAEMPAISKYVATHKRVSAIGLAWEDTPHEDLVKFAKKHPVDYPLAQVDVSKLPVGFDAPTALPTTYLIAPDGTVAKHFLGPIDSESLDSVIAAAAGQRSSAPTSSARH